MSKGSALLFYRLSLGRRNLTELQKSYLRGLQYKRERKKQGAPEGSKNALKNKGVKMIQLNLENSKDTAKRLGEQHKVSRSTIQRDDQLVDALSKVAENLGEDIKEKVISSL